MPGAPSARRFGQAIFQMAEDANQLPEWRQDLTTIAEVVGQPDVVMFLDSPQVPGERKLKIIDELLDDSTGELARNLVGLLAARNSVSTIPEIVGHFEQMLDARDGVVRAEVTTAVRLNSNQLDNLTRTLGKVVGAEVQIEAREDPNVLGGIVARVGDRVIDGSLRTKLQDMKRDLSR